MLGQLRPPIHGLILDMDGVLWKDHSPIGNLPAIFKAIAAQDLKVALVTNNATLTVADNLVKLRTFGVRLEPSQIITSAEAVADTLTKTLRPQAAIFVVGESGLLRVLSQRGFMVITEPGDSGAVFAVVAGIDRGFTYAKLWRAAAHIRAGAAFYGTNPDPTFPTPQGLVPGAGSMLAAIAAAAEVQPVIIGKPEPFMFQLAAERMGLGLNEILVVGDRLQTDIAGGQAWGARTALVLSGVSSLAQARERTQQPDLVADDLTQLLDAEG